MIYLCLLFCIFFIIFFDFVEVFHTWADNFENIIIRFEFDTKSSKYSPHMRITVYVRAFEDCGVLKKKFLQ